MWRPYLGVHQTACCAEGVDRVWLGELEKEVSAMNMPGFNAEASLYKMSERYQPQLASINSDTAGVVPAQEVYIPLGGVLFRCYPCMSGGPSGALMTYCCDPIASIPETMSR